MIKIVPTILTDTAQNFNQIAEVYQKFANRIQIDISDGQFSPYPTVQLKDITFPQNWNGEWDLHLMVKSPSLYIQDILRLHPSLCIFHAESDENLLPLFETLNQAGIKTGVAILRSTFPGNIKPYIDACDHVLIFGGTLGRQGGEADMIQLEKAAIIKEIDPNVEIGWDGGANLDNIRAIAHAGIDVINVGAAISRAQNTSEAYVALQAEIEKTGVNL